MNKKVLLFLPQGFEAYEAAAFTDVMGWSRIKGAVPVDLVTAGFRTELTCTWNFTVRPEISYEEINTAEYDALALPGGFHRAGYYTDAFDERLLTLIRECNRDKKIIAAVCVAALALGKSGILTNRDATTYDLINKYHQKQLSEYGAHVVDGNPLVVDGNIVTSTGPKTAIDVAFKLLELLTDIDNVKTVKELMRFW